MNIVFVQSRQEFQSYVDFWKLVHLSGFSVCRTDEVNLNCEKVYIVSPLTVEWCPHVDKWRGRTRRAYLVLWNLERPSACGGIGGFRRQFEELLTGRYFDEIWVSDREIAHETGFRFVVLGSDARLGMPGRCKRYDAVYMAYINERRRGILEEFNDFNLAPNNYGWRRDWILKHARFGLNIHQDNHPFGEPLRLALFAAYGLPVLSEKIYDPYPFTEQTLVMAKASDLAGKLREMLGGNYWTYRQIGLAVRRLLCEQFPFERTVRKAVEKSYGDPICITGI